MFKRFHKLWSSLGERKSLRPRPPTSRARLKLEELEARRVPSVSPLGPDLKADHGLTARLEAALGRVQDDISQEALNVIHDAASLKVDQIWAKGLELRRAKLQANTALAADLGLRLERVRHDLARDQSDLEQDAARLDRDGARVHDLGAALDLLKADTAADQKGGTDGPGDRQLAAAVQALHDTLNGDAAWDETHTATDTAALQADRGRAADLRSLLDRVHAAMARDLKAHDVKNWLADTDRSTDLTARLDHAGDDIARDQADLNRDTQHHKADQELSAALEAALPTLRADATLDSR
jgi:hypothetical protein